MSTHPPTECTDLRRLAKVVEPSDIEKSVAWYEANRGAIASALPLEHQGVGFTVRWLENMDHRILSQWREGRLSMTLAEAYIYAALTKLFKAMKEAQAI
ncbi:MAG: hypothetical protein AAGI45_13020 [Cyanobacteria bacterium P01_H01_bin.26]